VERVNDGTAYPARGGSRPEAPVRFAARPA
jgi:hypothetical protein